MIPVTDLRPGLIFKEQGNLFRVLEYKHQKIARGGGTIIVKVKNLKTGSNLRKTFPSRAKVDNIQLTILEAVYLYSQGSSHFFMDNSTYEQFELSSKILGGTVSFLREGIKAKVRLFGKDIVDVELPIKVEYKVVEAPPDFRGDTSQSSVKNVILENGLNVKVPMFIKKGDRVRIDTRDGKYVERV